MREQADIVALLDHMGNKVELNSRMNETLETIAQAIFKSWLVDFDPVAPKPKPANPQACPPTSLPCLQAEPVDSPLGNIARGCSQHSALKLNGMAASP